MAKDHEWQPGTLFDNVDAAVRALGVTAPGVVWGIANVDWPTVEDRDRFLYALSQRGKASA